MMLHTLVGGVAALSGAKVLLRGASGFLGRHLAGRLCAAGATVLAVSRRARTSETPGLHWYQVPLDRMGPVRRLLKQTQPDVICHLSGHVPGDPALEQVLPTLSSLLQNTVVLLAAGADQGCGRFVLAGSLTEPAPDRSSSPPVSPYSAAKVVATAYGRMLHSLYGLPVVTGLA